MLSDKQSRVVVTGGLGLIGGAIARSFANTGASVAVVDNDRDRWDKVRASDVAVRGMNFIDADLTRLEAVPDLVARIDGEHDGFDTWVNCHYPQTPNWGTSDDRPSLSVWRQNVDMHLTGYCVISTEVAHRMAARKRGCLINIASIYGVVGPDYSIYEGLNMTVPPPYPPIKGGIIAYSRSLATYWGRHNVRVNVVCPGGVVNAQADSFVTAYIKRTPLGRLATPEEVAGPVVFLASSAASYITGAVLMVDGGWTAQ